MYSRNDNKFKALIVGLLLFILFIGFFVNLFVIQVWDVKQDPEKYSIFKDGRLRNEPIHSIRGEIFDREGELLVRSVLSTKLTIIPADFRPDRSAENAQNIYDMRLDLVARLISHTAINRLLSQKLDFINDPDIRNEIKNIIFKHIMSNKLEILKMDQTALQISDEISSEVDIFQIYYALVRDILYKINGNDFANIQLPEYEKRIRKTILLNLNHIFDPQQEQLIENIIFAGIKNKNLEQMKSNDNILSICENIFSRLSEPKIHFGFIKQIIDNDNLLDFINQNLYSIIDTADREKAAEIIYNEVITSKLAALENQNKLAEISNKISTAINSSSNFENQLITIFTKYLYSVENLVKENLYCVSDPFEIQIAREIIFYEMKTRNLDDLERQETVNQISDRISSSLNNSKSYVSCITNIIDKFSGNNTDDVDDIIRQKISFIRRIVERDSRNSNPYEPKLIKDNLSDEELIYFEENQEYIPGVICNTSQLRQYIGNEMLSHILGVTGCISETQLIAFNSADSENAGRYRPDSTIGKLGVEKVYDLELRGYDGVKSYLVNSLGERISGSTEVLREPQHGYNIRLTVDYGIQRVASQALGDRRGCVIVSHPRTGEILALVSSPGFNPNSFSSDFVYLNNDQVNRPLINRAIVGNYPPSSTFKLVVASAALESDTFDPYLRFDCRGGITLGRDRQWFGCTKIHGPLNLSKAIQYSCNSYFYHTGVELGWNTVYEMAYKLGYGQETGIDIGYEAPGLLPSEQWKLDTFGERWYTGNTAHASIGQGYLLVTPLQVHNLVSAIANYGTVYTPHILLDVFDNEQDIIRHVYPEVRSEEVISHATAQFLQTAMRRVVTNGTAYYARFSSAPIAGKTGTGQNNDCHRNSYGETLSDGEECTPHAWFTSFAPYIGPANTEQNPNFEISPEVLSYYEENGPVAVTVFIENGGYGGSAAAPVATVVMNYIFKNMSIQESQNLMNLVLYVETEEDRNVLEERMLLEHRRQEAQSNRSFINRLEEQVRSDISNQSEIIIPDNIEEQIVNPHVNQNTTQRNSTHNAAQSSRNQSGTNNDTGSRNQGTAQSQNNTSANNTASTSGNNTTSQPERANQNQSNQQNSNNQTQRNNTTVQNNTSESQQQIQSNQQNQSQSNNTSNQSTSINERPHTSDNTQSSQQTNEVQNNTTQNDPQTHHQTQTNQQTPNENQDHWQRNQISPDPLSTAINEAITLDVSEIRQHLEQEAEEEQQRLRDEINENSQGNQATNQEAIPESESINDSNVRDITPDMAERNREFHERLLQEQSQVDDTIMDAIEGYSEELIREFDSSEEEKQE